MDENRRAVEEILALERAGLDRWAAGDPSGFLAVCAPDVTYFDPFLPRRLDGLQALTRYYESLRGRIHVDRYEMVNPRVEVQGDVAILTFNYVSWSGSATSRWNCTEAYRRTPGGWQLFQTHWSMTEARPRAEAASA